MIYDKIFFTGLTLDGDNVLPSRCHEGVIPPEWSRVTITENISSVASNKRWIEKNLGGKYAIYSNIKTLEIYFEDKVSAVYYKLLDGNSAAVNEQIIQVL